MHRTLCQQAQGLKKGLTVLQRSEVEQRKGKAVDFFDVVSPVAEEEAEINVSGSRSSAK